MKPCFFIFIFTFALWSCQKNDHGYGTGTAYIGGEIINPTTEFVILSKGLSFFDTIQLNQSNRFLYKIDSLEEGLYKFKHGREYQMIFLEPNDSVIFRLNTLAFDESLVFTGIGDKKNNFLIDTFLEFENDQKYSIKLCQSKPEVYQKYVDSLKKIKTKALFEFKSQTKTSALFDTIILNNIKYHYFSNKEVYPFMHFGKNKAALLKAIPEDFYSYRKNINYNDTLRYSDSNYKMFLKHNLSNVSLKTHFSHSHNEDFNRTSVCYNLDRLTLIDQLVSHPVLKSELLEYFTLSFLVNNKILSNNSVVIKSFLSKSYDDKSKKIISKYAQSLNNLKKGRVIPDVTLTNYLKQDIKLQKLIRKPTVISFWSLNYYEHFKAAHKKIRSLKEKYPETHFITINMNAYEFNKSRELLLTHGFDLKNEYLFKNPKKAQDILGIYPMTKTILVNKNKTITHSNTNIFSVSFEKQLLEIVNQ